MSKSEPVIRRVFITKYALTVGLFSQMAEQCIGEHADRKGNKPVYWRGLDRFPGFFREGIDAFTDEGAARLDVKKKAEAKIKSLEKSLKAARELATTGHQTMAIEEKPDPRVNTGG